MSAATTSVAGLQLPALLGGHPALELCNTRAGWAGGAQREYLGSYDHLARWANHVELIDTATAEELIAAAASQPRRARAALARAVALRESLYAVLAHDHDRSASAFEPIAGAVHAAGAHLRLRPGPDAARLEIDPATGLEMPVHAAAWSAAGLLTSAAVASVRACPGSGCGWLFLDPSGRRRWCTMATCGNRAKVARFAQRHRGA